MAMLKNFCITCRDTWTFDASKATLDGIDRENLKRYGTVVSVCEDCNQGICESVEYEEETK